MPLHAAHRVVYMRRCILLGEEDECSDFELCLPVLSVCLSRGRLPVCVCRVSAGLVSAGLVSAGCLPVSCVCRSRGRAHRLSTDILSRFICVNCADTRVSILPLAASLCCFVGTRGST